MLIRAAMVVDGELTSQGMVDMELQRPVVLWAPNLGYGKFRCQQLQLPVVLPGAKFRVWQISLPGAAAESSGGGEQDHRAHGNYARRLPSW